MKASLFADNVYELSKRCFLLYEVYCAQTLKVKLTILLSIHATYIRDVMRKLC